MEQLSTILVIIGIIALVFSIWSFQLVRRHINQFRGSYRFTSSLTDEKYFELKSKQEFIVYAAAVAVGILTFVGFTSIKEIKTELNNQFAAERNKSVIFQKQRES